MKNSTKSSKRSIATTPPHAAEELGDLMLAIANAPRFIDHDAETTLRAACDKFVARFDEVARIAASRGLDLKVDVAG